MKIVVIILLLFCESAYAEKSIFTVYNVARYSCGKFIADTADNIQAKEVYSWWLGGFISATNMQKGRATTTDRYAHDLWIRNYCKDNPLQLYFSAAVMLDKYLSKKFDK